MIAQTAQNKLLASRLQPPLAQTKSILIAVCVVGKVRSFSIVSVHLLPICAQ